MPERATIERARRDAQQGKSASIQAGEFVREEIHHIREGKHGAKSAKQAIAIGLSKARRAGVKLPPPAKGKTSTAVRHQAARDLARGSRGQRASPTRVRAGIKALRKKSRRAASPRALARQAKQAARRRGPAARARAAKKTAHTRERIAA